MRGRNTNKNNRRKSNSKKYKILVFPGIEENGTNWLHDGSLVSGYENWCPGHNATIGEVGVYDVAGNCWKSSNTSESVKRPAVCMKFPPSCRNFPYSDGDFGPGKVYRGDGPTDYM